jgi:lipopolysaccharide transport system ATP-binding protein
MNELRSQAGRTIFLVSHNLEMIESLCNRGIVLNQGQVIFDGKANDALSKYRTLGGRGGEISINETNLIQWSGVHNREKLEGVAGDGDLEFVLRFRTGGVTLDGVFFDLELMDESGRRVTHSKTRFMRSGFTLRPNADMDIRYVVKAPMLAPGQYYLLVYVYNAGGVLAWVEHIDACTISSKSYFPAVHFIDDIKGATVPRFDIELL